MDFCLQPNDGLLVWRGDVVLRETSEQLATHKQAPTQLRHSCHKTLMFFASAYGILEQRSGTSLICFYNLDGSDYLDALGFVKQITIKVKIKFRKTCSWKLQYSFRTKLLLIRVL
jgi:hypothetical protein